VLNRAVFGRDFVARFSFGHSLSINPRAGSTRRSSGKIGGAGVLCQLFSQHCA
jgi:hypothetical protein